MSYLNPANFIHTEPTYDAIVEADKRRALAGSDDYNQRLIQKNASYDIRGNLEKANTAIGSMVDAAKDAQIQNTASTTQLGKDAGAMRAIVPQVQNDAQTQRGYAATFEGMGDQAKLNAAPWLAAGEGMLGLDAGAGGIAGEWVKNYNALSPDSLVSFAASDAQRSIENTRGQMARTLSRSGVSISSPAYVAALNEAKKYEQALLAGVKTRARLLGMKEQSSALQQGLQMAIGATGMGDQLTRQALAATQGASQATGAATDAEARAAGILGQAGGLESEKVRLGLAGNNTLANAQQVAADYYSTQASSTLGLLQSGAKTALSALFS